MDLGAFAEEVLEAVAGICGDTVVESHEQAADVLDALFQRPGVDTRELAAVFGVTSVQLSNAREAQRAKQDGREERRKKSNPVWWGLCESDAVYTWNVLTERINQAAHWREEFRDLSHAEGACEASEAEASEDEPALAEDVSVTSEAGDPSQSQASSTTRSKAQELMARHLEAAPEALRKQLAARLDLELFERFPSDKEYRPAARALTANLRRNTSLAAGYATGRVPPQWLVSVGFEALAPRLRQFQRRVEHKECENEVFEDADAAEMRRQMWDAAKGANLAPPPQCEEVI